MQLYYAQKHFAGTNISGGGGQGNFTSDLHDLSRFAPLGVMALNGSCSRLPTVMLAAARGEYTGRVVSLDGKREASITQDRLLLVVDLSAAGVGI